jgi:hypothetical protein
MEPELTEDVLKAVQHIDGVCFFSHPYENGLVTAFLRRVFKTPQDVYSVATYVIEGGQEGVKADFGPACAAFYRDQIELFRLRYGMETHEQIEKFDAECMPFFLQAAILSAEQLYGKGYYASAERMAALSACHSRMGTEEESFATDLWVKCIRTLAVECDNLPHANDRVKGVRVRVENFYGKKGSVLDLKSAELYRKLSSLSFARRTGAKTAYTL